MPDFSQNQLLSLLEQIAHNQDRIVTGRGSGSVGQTATFIVDRPIDGRNYVQATCLSACPPGNAQLFKTDSGQWFALGTQISNAIATKISQNRRHTPDQSGQVQVAVTFTVTFGLFGDQAPPKLFLKIDQQNLRLLDDATTSLEYRTGAMIPIARNQYVIQAITQDDSICKVYHWNNGTLNTFEGTGIPLPLNPALRSFSYPTNTIEPYLIKGNSSLMDAADYYPPVYLQAQTATGYLPLEGISSVSLAPYKGKWSNVDATTRNWYEVLTGKRYRVQPNYSSSMNFAPGRQSLKLSESDLALIGFTPDTPIQRAIDGAPAGTLGNPLPNINTSELKIVQGDMITFFSLQFYRGIVLR